MSKRSDDPKRVPSRPRRLQEVRDVVPGLISASSEAFATGLVIGESPRWQDVRVWFANWGTERIVALELAGNAEVAAKGPPGPQVVATDCPTVR